MTERYGSLLCGVHDGPLTTGTGSACVCIFGYLVVRVYIINYSSLTTHGIGTWLHRARLTATYRNTIIGCASGPKVAWSAILCERGGGTGRTGWVDGSQLGGIFEGTRW